MGWKRVAIVVGIAMLVIACTTTGGAQTSVAVDGPGQTDSTVSSTNSAVVGSQVNSPGGDESGTTTTAVSEATETTTTVSELTETTTTLGEASASTTTTSEPPEDIEDLIDDLNDLLSDLDDLLSGLDDEDADLDGAMNQSEGDIEE